MKIWKYENMKIWKYENMKISYYLEAFSLKYDIKVEIQDSFSKT